MEIVKVEGAFLLGSKILKYEGTLKKENRQFYGYTIDEIQNIRAVFGKYENGHIQMWNIGEICNNIIPIYAALDWQDMNLKKQRFSGMGFLQPIGAYLVCDEILGRTNFDFNSVSRLEKWLEKSDKTPISQKMLPPGLCSDEGVSIQLSLTQVKKF